MIINSYKTKDGKFVNANILIDWDTANDISLNNMQFYKHMVSIFFDELSENLIKLKTSVNFDYNSMHLNCHKYKGASAMIGFNKLSCLCYTFMTIFLEEDNIIKKKNINFQDPENIKKFVKLKAEYIKETSILIEFLKKELNNKL